MTKKFFTQLLLCNLFLLSTITISAQSTIKTSPENLHKPATELLQSYLNTQPTLRNSLSMSDLEIVENRLYDNTNTRTIRAWQKTNGIYIREGIVSLHFDKKGKLLPVDQLVKLNPNVATPAFDATEAVYRTMNYYGMPAAMNLQLKEDKFTSDRHVIFDRGMISASDIEARLIYMISPYSGELRLTWMTQLHTPDRQHYYMTFIDAQNGKVLDREDKVLHCDFGGGLVYDASPEEQARIDAEHHAMHMRAARNWDRMVESKQERRANETTTSTANISMSGPEHTYLVLKEPAEAPNDLDAYDGNPGHVTNSLGVDELEQQEVTTGGDMNASPRGWHDVQQTGPAVENNYTEGNNVWSFYDPSPSPLGGAPQQATSTLADVDGNYLVPWDLTKEPEYFDPADPAHPNPNRSAANINLFYWNNLIHDVYHYFDFTEEGRNFQNKNYTGAGIGNDHVLAQAQDGGGTNNANFLTLTDGVNGQMQMYLWTAAVDDRMVKVTSGLPGGNESFVAIEGAIYNSAMPPPTARVPGPTATVLESEIVLVNDGCSGGATNSSGTEACGTGAGGVGLPPCNNVSGKIVLIDRGSCSFVEKVHGIDQVTPKAIGVVVMNNDAANPDAVVAMGGTDPTLNTISIPSVMVSYNTGLKLKAALEGGATLMGRLQRDFEPQPKKDGDFDNGIICHEYGHGITIRTSPQTATGGSLSGPEQGGEGWADFIGLYMTMTKSDLITDGVDLVEHPNGVLPDRGIGSYIRYTGYDGPGIRPRRYSIDEGVNPYTFGGTSNGGLGIGNAPEVVAPHGVGFVWCTMLYEMTQKMVDLYGISELENRLYNAPNSLDDMIINGGTADGMNIAMRLILKGIELQPATPTFDQMRDGILAADDQLFGGIHKCDIWKAFAKRGLGIDAINPNNSLGNETDGYGIPAECLEPGEEQVFYSLRKIATTIINNQEELTYTIRIGNTSPTGDEATNVVITDDLPANTTFVSATGGDMMTNTANSVTWTINSLPAGGVELLTVTVLLALPSTTGILSKYTFEDDANGWTTGGGGANNNWNREEGDAAHSGQFYFFCENSNLSDPNAHLISPVLPTGTDRQLRFWHRYDMDGGYDGGFVEVTTDGINWSKLNLQENPYTGSLNGTFNPLNAGSAYTGSAERYIESAGTLPDDVIQVRFVLSEDVGGGSGVGWWIDDIQIVENPVKVVNSVSITDPAPSNRTKTSTASTLVFGEGVNLSVNLVDLKATPQEESIQLDWATATETENDGFQIERRGENETTFKTIGFVRGQGTTSEKTDYVFVDKDVEVNQLYSYRLLQRDFSGKETYSNIVTAEIVGQDITMDIVPNPAKDFAQVSIENATDNSAVEVLSMDGKVLRTYAIGKADQQNITLNLADLAAGMYMVQLKTAKGAVTEKLVIE